MVIYIIEKRIYKNLFHNKESFTFAIKGYFSLLFFYKIMIKNLQRENKTVVQKRALLEGYARLSSPKESLAQRNVKTFRPFLGM